MQKLKPTHQAGHQSLHRASITINSKHGSFSLSLKARECMKIKASSKFNIIENKGLFYIQPAEQGDFVFLSKKSQPNRLFVRDKQIANLILTTYKIKSESAMLSISENQTIVVSELNCFAINK